MTALYWFLLVWAVAAVLFVLAVARINSVLAGDDE